MGLFKRRFFTPLHGEVSLEHVQIMFLLQIAIFLFCLRSFSSFILICFCIFEGFPSPLLVVQNS